MMRWSTNPQLPALVVVATLLFHGQPSEAFLDHARLVTSPPPCFVGATGTRQPPMIVAPSDATHSRRRRHTSHNNRMVLHNNANDNHKQSGIVSTTTITTTHTDDNDQDQATTILNQERFLADMDRELTHFKDLTTTTTTTEERIQQLTLHARFLSAKYDATPAINATTSTRTISSSTAKTLDVYELAWKRIQLLAEKARVLSEKYQMEIDQIRNTTTAAAASTVTTTVVASEAQEAITTTTTTTTTSPTPTAFVRGSVAICVVAAVVMTQPPDLMNLPDMSSMVPNCLDTVVQAQLMDHAVAVAQQTHDLVNNLVDTVQTATRDALAAVQSQSVRVEQLFQDAWMEQAKQYSWQDQWSLPQSSSSSSDLPFRNVINGIPESLSFSHKVKDASSFFQEHASHVRDHIQSTLSRIKSFSSSVD